MRIPASLLSVFALFVPLQAEEDRPNVIVVMTDDQGWPELSAHGNPVLKTPALDDLRSESIRFNDFHVAPMCTPTRGQLLTGQDAVRHRAINVSSGRTLLKAGLPTMADHFKAAGYRTGIFGKWHLGDNYPFRPRDRGFEEALWFPSSHINSVPDVWNNDYFDDTYRRNGKEVAYRGYCMDVFFTEAMKWMRVRYEAGESFFAYIPTNAPHSPLWVPQNYREAMEKDMAEAEAAGRIARLDPTLRANLITYLAMIRNIDDNMARLDAFLADHNLTENTIVIFMTDNGSTYGERYYPAGMRGRKTQLWEGGHRVPCFLRWPDGGLGEPRDVEGLTQAQDLLPTLLEFCGVEPIGEVEMDGISLAAQLRGEAEADPERMLIINYSRMPQGFTYPSPDSPSRMRKEGAAVLWKRWRLLEDRELYNLESDPMQQTDVIDEHPEIAARMSAHLDDWWSEVADTANDPERVIIGHDAENPTKLTACEWLDVFIDLQRQVRNADRKNGYWELEVAEAGEYEFELRRWPRDAGVPLSAGIEATKVTDGELLPGRALPIAKARLGIDGKMLRQNVGPEAEAATFHVKLPAGPARLHTWFEDENRQAIVGAYYVYVKRL